LISEYYSTRPDLFETNIKKYKLHTNRFIVFISEFFPQSFDYIATLRFSYVIELFNEHKTIKFESVGEKAKLFMN